MPRDILATLQTEHDTLRNLFSQMEETSDRAKKKREQLLNALTEVVFQLPQLLTFAAEGLTGVARGKSWTTFSVTDSTFFRV